MANGTATYTLKFNADVSEAKRELQGLQNSISNLVTLNNKIDPLKDFKSSMNDAVKDVAKLSAELAAATNNNGTLNIGKLANAWKSSGKTLDDYRRSLNALGPEGEQAFKNLATAIHNAQQPVRELDGLIGKFAKGLANTAMWTLQSNAIHAVQGALQSAYGYAQQLNKGLTDIAIVSDLDTKQLTQFAKTANQMAKELSASTSDYISGALIYYQAGLSDEEVIERTNTTIKLAQTSGETAEQISSYMTAIWNNFYDGSKSVEYYADAISYLGAVTAASNADIAEGMQAFSAVANTVGLSFEYGASALTLLRDITQQSASAIGNSLKTIFARLSSVAQGDTLEDGVDLTKYSKALDTVGVSVLDVNGNLRDMDNILDDLGARWDSLTNAQKVALAQTVGGVRQYNNLISLMDNYEKFQELVSEASGSDGYLQHQADIYAKSWEAARNRVQAAWQGIFDTVINDKTLITLTDIFANILNILGEILEKSGGLTTILPLIVSLLGIGINDNLTKINTRFIEIVKNTVQFKQTLRDAKALQDQARQAALEWKFVPNSDTDANTLNSLQDKYSNLLTKIQQMRSLGAGEDVIQAATLEAQRYYNVLSAIVDKTEDLEKVRAGAYTGVYLPSSNENSAEDIIAKTAINSRRETIFNNFKSYQNGSWEGPGGAEKMRNWAAQYRSALIDEEGEVLDDSLDDLLRRMASYKNKNNPNGGISSAAFKKYTKEFSGLVNSELYKSFLDVKEPDSLINKLYKQFGVDKDAIEELKKNNENGQNDDKISKVSETRNKIKKEIEDAVNAGKLEGQLWGAQLEAGDGLDETITSYDKFNQKLKETNASLSANAGYILSVVNGLVSFVSALDSTWEGLKKLGSGEISDGLTQIGSGLLAIGASSLMIMNAVENSTLLSGAVTSLGTALAPAATGSAALAIGLGAVASAVLLVVAAVKIGIKLWKNYQENLPENKLKKTNEQLEKQKTYVSELTSEYENLSSTLKNLTDEYNELNKKQKGTLDYLMALEAWNSKLAELEKKYGVTFETDENGAKILDEDKITEAISRQLSMAQAERQTLEIKSARQAREIAETQVFGSAIDIKKGLKKYKDVSGTEAYKINGEFVAVDKFDKYVDDFMALAKEDLSGDDAEAKIRAVLEDADDNIIQFFLSKLQNLNEAIQAEQKVDNFSNLVGNTLRGKNIYAAAAESGHNSEEVNAAINAYAKDQTELYREESKAINYADAIAAYEQAHNVKYSDSDDKFYELTESGEIDKDKPLDIEVSDAVTAYITSRVVQDLRNLDADKIADIVNKYYSGDGNIINEGVIAKLAQEEANRKQLTADIKTATELGFDKEEYQQYVEYLQETNEKLKQNQALADEVALANMRLTRGLNDLEDNGSDWLDTIDAGLEKGNEWYKNSLKYHQALDGIKTDLADIANVDVGSLSSIDGEWVKKHQKIIEKAFNGDKDAVDTLVKDLNTEIISGIDNNTNNALTEWESALIKTFNDINLPDLEVGISELGGQEELLTALQTMITASNLTAEQINTALKGIHFSPIVEWKTVPFNNVDTSTIESGGYVTYTDDDGVKHQLAATDVRGLATAKETGVMQIPVIKSGDGSEQVGTRPNIMQALATSKFVGGTGRQAQPPKTSGSKNNGSSSKKSKEADTTRYHEINSKLEQTSHYLDMVNTAEDRAYGQKKLDLMDEKIKLLEREAEQYKQLYDEAKRYYDQDRDRLQNQYGAAFNADGSIANYDAWYKQFVDRYNAGGMDDDAWSAFEDAIKKYEDSLKHLNDAEKKYQDDLNKIFDQKLEKIEYRLKTITDIIKLDMDYLDYMIEMLDDDGLDTAEAMAYIAKEIADVTDQYTANKQALADIFKNHEGITDDLISGLYNGTVTVQQFIDTVGNFTEKEIESIKSIMSSMYSNGKDLKKYIEDLYGKLGELSDKFQESLDKQIDKLDHMNDIIDKTRNIIDVMGKDTLGISDELLNRMQRAQIEIGKEHLATLMQERDQYKLWLEQLEAQYAIMDPESLEAKALKEQIEAYRKTYEEVEREILDTANMTAEQIQQLYITMIEQTVTEAGNKIAGAVGDFEKLMDAYDKQKDLDDLYLKTYEKTYQTNKLLRDIGKSLDDTANLGMQGKLRDLQEEILGYQQEGKQVTEEQMEERRKYYELLLAEAALEEAQNAKNMVRMTRDNEGNWSYTYTADQGQLDDLMNDYNDKLFAYEDYNQKTLESAQDTLLNLQNEYLEALKNARDEAEVQALQAYYEPMIEHQRNMVDYMLMRNNELADNFNVNADEVATKLDDTVYGITTGFDSMDEAMATFDEAMRIAKDNVIANLQDMDAEQIALANSVGITAPEVEQKLDDIEQGVKDVHTAVAGDGTDENPGIAKDFDNEFNDALDTLKGFHETMGPIIDSIVEDIGKINNKVTEVISAYSELNGVTITPPDLSGAISAMNALKAAAEAAGDAMRNAGGDGGKTSNQVTPGYVYKTRAGNHGTTYYDYYYRNADGSLSHAGTHTYKIYGGTSIGTFASGGYTGSFGPEGRMAILHEKELVLNKADTQNLLTTVSFVRDLTRMISLNAADASSGLGNLFMGGVGQGGGYLDQTVTIHAEFPNATNHSEIEEAFSNLIGLASQYAGRKR